MTDNIRDSCFYAKMILVAFLLVISINTYCQTAAVGNGQEIQFDHISKDELSENVIFCMTQDANGFMWFGTQTGLDRYDGVAFKNYSSAIGKNIISDGF